jgi:hypothetical protein
MCEVDSVSPHHTVIITTMTTTKTTTTIIIIIIIIIIIKWLGELVELVCISFHLGTN